MNKKLSRQFNTANGEVICAPALRSSVVVHPLFDLSKKMSKRQKRNAKAKEMERKSMIQSPTLRACNAVRDMADLKMSRRMGFTNGSFASAVYGHYEKTRI